MYLIDLTTETNEDGSKIVRVSGRIADHPQIAEQSEWISFQFATELPTVRNGALLRSEALRLVHEKALQLSQQFERLGRAP